MSATRCPGCGLKLPTQPGLTGHAYINASPECWSVYGEVLAAEYGDPIVFGAVHQLTVDAYVAQHPGGDHPARSVVTHLVALWFAFEAGRPQRELVTVRQQLASRVEAWPELSPPVTPAATTVLDVALAASPEEHMELVRRWAAEVWASWHAAHAEVARLAATVTLPSTSSGGAG